MQQINVKGASANKFKGREVRSEKWELLWCIKVAEEHKHHQHSEDASKIESQIFQDGTVGMGRQGYGWEITYQQHDHPWFIRYSEECAEMTAHQSSYIEKQVILPQTDTQKSWHVKE